MLWEFQCFGRCPIFKKDREDHKDAWVGSLKATSPCRHLKVNPLVNHPIFGLHNLGGPEFCRFSILRRWIPLCLGRLILQLSCLVGPTSSTPAWFFWSPSPHTFAYQGELRLQEQPPSNGGQRREFRPAAHPSEQKNSNLHWWFSSSMMGPSYSTDVGNARVIPQPGDGSCLYHSLSYGAGAKRIRRKCLGRFHNWWQCKLGI